MSAPEDRFTNTVADAAAYEAYRAQDDDDYDDGGGEYDEPEEEEDYEEHCGCGDYYCAECA